MSTFVVSSETMHKVVRLIVRGGLTVNFAGFAPDQGPARNADAIGRALFALNIDAVMDRYPDCKGQPGNLPGSTDSAEMPTSYQFNDNWKDLTRRERIILHKAATALLYQCSEGGIPERLLYKELATLIDANARVIVSDLPEYNAAPWD